MSASIILGSDRAQALAHYPHAKWAGDTLYLCGTSCRRADNTHAGVTQSADGSFELDIRAQTEAVIQNMEVILKEAGLTLRDLVDVTTYLTDMAHFGGYNEVYNRFFEKGWGPARTTVAVAQLPHPNLLIEMKGIAHRPPTGSAGAANQGANS